MSFILDALKKSETDRQQKSSPGIADVPNASRRSPTPRWIPALVALLLVNLAAVAYLVLRPAAPSDEPARAATTAGPSAKASSRSVETAAGTAADATDEAPANRLPARAAERANPDPAPSATTSVTAMQLTRDPQPVPPAAEVSTSTAVRSPAPAAEPVEDENWLTINDLRASGQLDLPELHIDLHVFSDNPGDRFVFINMNEYRENSTLPEGPIVKRITTEGVLLDYRGTTFLLPRD